MSVHTILPTAFKISFHPLLTAALRTKGTTQCVSSDAAIFWTSCLGLLSGTFTILPYNAHNVTAAVKYSVHQKLWLSIDVSIS